MATVAEYLSNPDWAKKVEQTFVSLDLNKNGYVSREDFMLGIDKLAEKYTDRPDLIEKLRKVTLEYTEALGLTEGVKADKKKYLELAAEMVIKEAARAKRGEETWIEKSNRASFDVLDKNRNGYLTWDEYRELTYVYSIDPTALKAAFDFLDKNKDGKINQKEFSAAQVKFWTTLNDPETRDMLGKDFKQDN